VTTRIKRTAGFEWIEVCLSPKTSS